MAKTTNLSPKEKIFKLLRSTKRPGIEGLLRYLLENGFFESPASMYYHNDYRGGLADHSLNVFANLINCYRDIKLQIPTERGQKPLDIEPENLAIAALLHDVCKVGMYTGNDVNGYKLTKGRPKGHASLSIERIVRFIKLEELEVMMIRYHMGVYGLKEFDPKAGEYHLLAKNPTASKEERYGKSLRNAWYHNPIVKVMYFCDELATLTEKAAKQ